MLGAKGIWKLKQALNPDPYPSETDMLTMKENIVCLFLVGANKLILILTVQDMMETETIMKLPDGLKKRLEWAAVVGLENI